MSEQAIALLDVKRGWLVRVTELPSARADGLRHVPRPPVIVIGVVSQVEERLFRVGSLAELGDGKSYVFKRAARPELKVEILDRSYELNAEVIDPRPAHSTTSDVRTFLGAQI